MPPRYWRGSSLSAARSAASAPSTTESAPSTTSTCGFFCRIELIVWKALSFCVCAGSTSATILAPGTVAIASRIALKRGRTGSIESWLRITTFALPPSSSLM